MGGGGGLKVPNDDKQRRVAWHGTNLIHCLQWCLDIKNVAVKYIG